MKKKHWKKPLEKVKRQTKSPENRDFIFMLKSLFSTKRSFVAYRVLRGLSPKQEFEDGVLKVLRMLRRS